MMENWIAQNEDVWSVCITHWAHTHTATIRTHRERFYISFSVCAFLCVLPARAHKQADLSNHLPHTPRSPARPPLTVRPPGLPPIFAYGGGRGTIGKGGGDRRAGLRRKDKNMSGVYLYVCAHPREPACGHGCDLQIRVAILPQSHWLTVVSL